MSDLTLDTCRLDVWLYAARFFKTRQLAVAAIKNGRVMVNQQRTKPARPLHLEDVIFIHKQADLEYEVIVKALSHKRVSAKVAKDFYQETTKSIRNREQLRLQQQLAHQLVSYPERRPDKRDRRTIRTIRHNMESL